MISLKVGTTSKQYFVLSLIKSKYRLVYTFDAAHVLEILDPGASSQRLSPFSHPLIAHGRTAGHEFVLD